MTFISWMDPLVLDPIKREAHPLLFPNEIGTQPYRHWIHTKANSKIEAHLPLSSLISLIRESSIIVRFSRLGAEAVKSFLTRRGT